MPSGNRFPKHNRYSGDRNYRIRHGDPFNERDQPDPNNFRGPGVAIGEPLPDDARRSADKR